MFKRSSEKNNAGLGVFVIYDSKVGAYERPHFEKNDKVVMREVLNMFKDPSQAKNKYLVNAEDYSVFKVGDLDLQTGVLEAHKPEHVCNMHDLRFMADSQKKYEESPEIPGVGINPT